MAVVVRNMNKRTSYITFVCTFNPNFNIEINLFLRISSFDFFFFHIFPFFTFQVYLRNLNAKKIHYIESHLKLKICKKPI